MVSKNTSVVTGAFGYSGRYIARRLLDAGVEVRTLTNAPDSQSPFGSRVRGIPFSFDDHARLVEALKGAAVLYNTYWVRFNHAKFRQVDAVRNTLALFRAAREAGVQRVVHLSITSCYLSGKRFAQAVRGHWGIENSLRWVLDVTFDEDQSRTRERFAASNLSWLRRIAISLLKRHPSKHSIKGKREIAGWSNEFLMQVLMEQGT